MQRLIYLHLVGSYVGSYGHLPVISPPCFTCQMTCQNFSLTRQTLAGFGRALATPREGPPRPIRRLIDLFRTNVIRGAGTLL